MESITKRRSASGGPPFFFSACRFNQIGTKLDALKKWFQNLRSGFPLERGITRLDFNKLRCASNQGVLRIEMRVSERTR